MYNNTTEWIAEFGEVMDSTTNCNTLQYTATKCNTLQQTATHCNKLQHTATQCNTLPHTAEWMTEFRDEMDPDPPLFWATSFSTPRSSEFFTDLL